MIEGQQEVDGGPSILYDAVAILVSADGAVKLSTDMPSKDFVSEAFGHAKFIGFSADALPLIQKAGIGDGDMDEGLCPLDAPTDAAAFIDTCGQRRLWARELTVNFDAAAFLATSEA